MNEAEKEMKDSIAEVREWMVRNDENQKHIKELLEVNNAQTQKSLEVAYDSKYESAENKRQQKNLKWQIDTNKKEFNDYQRDQAQEKKWVIGLAVTVALALLPILLKFYSDVITGLQ